MRFLQSFDLTIAVSLLSLALTTYLFFVTPKQQMIKERYEKIIFPLFSFIEPYLYANVSTVDLTKLIALYKENAAFAGRKIHESFYYLEKTKSQDDYNELCSHISMEYDKCCFILGLKMRSVYYRIVRKQYKTKLFLIFYMAFQILLLLFSFLLFISTLVSITMFLEHLILR